MEKKKKKKRQTNVSPVYWIEMQEFLKCDPGTELCILTYLTN